MSEKIIVYAFVIIEQNAAPEITATDEQRVKDWYKKGDIKVVFISPGEWEQPEIISIAGDVQDHILDIGTGIKNYMLSNQLHPDFVEIANDFIFQSLERGGLIFNAPNGKAYMVFPTIRKD